MHFRALPKQSLNPLKRGRNTMVSRNEWRKKLLLMKFTTILLLAACLQVSARGLAQKITISERNAPLEKILKQIHKQTGYQFFYESALVDNFGNISIRVKDAPIEKVLALCFDEKPVTYAIRNNSITITANITNPPPCIT